jgi:hypothetical protein
MHDDTKPNSFAAEVQTGTGSAWTGNGLRFPTDTSARTYAKDLQSRWTLVSAIRVIASDDPVTVDAEGKHIHSGSSVIKGAGHRVHL